ncbi:fungal-specific transcription factor domain-containing protein [Aspergillus cavernicola]|uniref:Fungal-specific transcription factor domain-containing protein n=1 Tax=Aspergillus cavernicola TaxID=176166 RepID=A0ABR4IRS2_9EURO
MSDPNACATFHQYGQRCSALAPCRNCRQRLESSNSAHGVPARDGESSGSYYSDLLHDLFKFIQSIDHAETLPLLDMIRNDASFEEVRFYIDEAVAGKSAHDKSRDTSCLVSTLERSYEMESDAPRFRPKVMDVHYLCDFAPVKVPARPWTTVTDDDALVSHLVSLYFTWDYPFYAFIDREIFVQHMAMGEVQSDFCSPFLVNALLANACHYSQYSEAYTVPGDVKTKGTDFLAEAEKYLQSNMFEKGSVIRLASIQATLLLYERYSMVGDNDKGYLMLNHALDMAESLGIINNPKLNLNRSHMSEDMISSVKRTAWGLFQIDTIVHTNFLRPSRVADVSIERIDRDASKFTDLWIPYPLHRVPRPSWLSQCFDEACGLSYIARDISRTLTPNSETNSNVRKQKQMLHKQLQQWEANLPAIFMPTEKPPPHIILLRMRYHALLINLYCDWFYGKPPFNFQEPSTRIAEAGALETALSSARQISALTRLHNEEFGMDRAHQFAMYAILLALFAFLEQQSFNVLDHDFLSLTSAFSTMARRSQVGMNLFHVFRHSVRTRLESGKSASSIKMPTEIQELFGSESIKSPDRWTHYAEGLQRLADDGEYFGIVNESGQPYAASGIGDMLRKYESLTLGKADDMQGREESSNFGFSP